MRRQALKPHVSRLTTRSGLLFEVAVLEDIGSGTDQAEADLVVAGIAHGKCSAPEHYDFVRLAMVAAVYDFVNSRFADWIAGLKFWSVCGRPVPVRVFGLTVHCAKIARRTLNVESFYLITSSLYLHQFER